MDMQLDIYTSGMVRVWPSRKLLLKSVALTGEALADGTHDSNDCLLCTSKEGSGCNGCPVPVYYKKTCSGFKIFRMRDDDRMVKSIIKKLARMALRIQELEEW